MSHRTSKTFKQVCVLLRTYAESAALPTFAAAAQCCCGAGRAAIDRYLLLTGPSAANPPHAVVSTCLVPRALSSYGYRTFEKATVSKTDHMQINISEKLKYTSELTYEFAFQLIRMQTSFVV